LCAAIAVTAAEGGINYWAQLIDYDPRFSTDSTIAYDAFPLVLISPVEDDLFEEDDLDHRALPLLLGDEDMEDGRLGLRLSATAIRRGLNRVRMQRLPHLDSFYRALEGEDFDQASLHIDARLA